MARSLITFSALLAGAQAGIFPRFDAAEGPKSCPADTPLSCQNSTQVQDLCCFNSPGGQLLLTQFWDYDPSTGPADSWTLHGLWPDHCDGGYDANCDPSREYSNITDILSAGGADETLSYMNEYWKDYQGDDEQFWSHEWNKHGTCISTIEPTCYADYKPTQEVVDFFTKTVEIFKTLPSYKWLEEAGITPSESEEYNVEDIQAALSKKHGKEVTLGCKSGALNEIWYHYNVQGSVVGGKFEAAEPDGMKTTCKGSVKYLPKSGGGGGNSTATLTPFSKDRRDLPVAARAERRVSRPLF